MKDSDFWAMMVLIAFFVLTIVFVAVRGCEDRDGATNALQSAGFTDIELGEWQLFACSNGDAFNNSFRATNPRGKKVTGVVCCGTMKRCTIRY